MAISPLKGALRRVLAFSHTRIWLTGWILGLLLTGSFSAVAGVPLQKESDYTQGVRAYRSGNYWQAERYFNQTLSREPNHVNAHYYRALVLDNLGRHQVALNEYRYVIEHGREASIVSYARERASLTNVDTPPPRGHIASSASSHSSNVVMMASGGVNAIVADKVANYPMAVPLKSSRTALILDTVLKNGSRQAQGDFIVDTGATYTSISQELANQLGLDLQQCERVRITTANGRIEVPKVIIASLNVNGLEARNVEATVIPVRQGSSFSGLLGLSFLRQFVVTIDPQAGQLIFNKHPD